uniref:CX domain-containing protein n=1 Tax=Panagrolaimus davidi TaxID=227884 RepID=A0A914Q5R4_9BILA
MKLISFFVAFIAAFECVISLGLKSVRFPESPEALHTRSLSGGPVTDGNNVTNAMVLNLITVGLLGGYARRKVKAFNDRIFLSRYRRSYWLGSRYYYLDNYYYLETRDTCAYRMNSTERAGLEYEDGVTIVDVIYQCQRYAQYCCGLDCCDDRGKRNAFKKNYVTKYLENH